MKIVRIGMQSISHRCSRCQDDSIEISTLSDLVHELFSVSELHYCDKLAVRDMPGAQHGTVVSISNIGSWLVVKIGQAWRVRMQGIQKIRFYLRKIQELNDYDWIYLKEKVDQGRMRDILEVQ